MTPGLPRLYLLDVEGTVAPISFVYEQLFPYARQRFADFLEEHGEEPNVQADLRMLTEENRADPEAPQIGESDHPNQTVAYLHWLMDQDRKSTALKSLQGRVWKRGFEFGELKGMLYGDVPAAFDRWAAKAQVAIYSSGSVDAQRLFFGYSIFGDLTDRIAAYFDTRIGAKTVRESYTAISAAMNLQPHQVMFFSDVVRELDAAREAGFDTYLVVRAGNSPVEDMHEHVAIHSFDGIP